MSDAPIFTPEQVAALWTHQFGPWNENPLTPDYKPRMHPFTCAARADHPVVAGDRGVLVPTVRGWICPFCDYRQTGAHVLMMGAAPHSRKTS